MKFDHVGIFVGDIAEGRRLLSAMLGINRWTKVFEDPVIGVYVQFGTNGDGPCYELIAPLGAENPVSGVLKSGRNILNHVAYLVPDLTRAASELRELGSMPVSEAKPAVAYDGNHVQFFLSPMRFIIELIEAPEHRHLYNDSER